MTEFILNNKLIRTEIPPTTILLDFIRYEENLKGTKIGCREGDCGACTVLVGSLAENMMVYKSVVSCLTPVGNIAGKHVVTVEGINTEDLTQVQQALHNHSGTQCGFCTPGFVVSLTGYAVSHNENTYEDAISFVSGNICRCTGYKSIEKAVSEIVSFLKDKPSLNSIDWLIEQNFLPEYFKLIPDRLKELKSDGNLSEFDHIIGGGTDLYVQKPDETTDSKAIFLLNNRELKGIKEVNGFIELGASVTVSEIMDSEIMNTIFPDLNDHFLLISSEQIRNTATLAGNIVNASPIGDLSIFFLALDAVLILKNKNNNHRELGLKDFFKAYKTVDLNEGEIIEKLKFKIPNENFKFNFEKVSKRTYLDIASVNSAVSYYTKDNIIKDIHISGGGLAPIPVYFSKTGRFLTGKKLERSNLEEASELLLTEVDPISDIRGSKEYKKLLLKQLFFCHFEKEKRG